MFLNGATNYYIDESGEIFAEKDGEIYQYEADGLGGMGGFFKKVKKAVSKPIKKAVKAAGKGAEKGAKKAVSTHLKAIEIGTSAVASKAGQPKMQGGSLSDYGKSIFSSMMQSTAEALQPQTVSNIPQQYSAPRMGQSTNNMIPLVLGVSAVGLLLIFLKRK